MAGCANALSQEDDVSHYIGLSLERAGDHAEEHDRERPPAIHLAADLTSFFKLDASAYEVNSRSPRWKRASAWARFHVRECLEAYTAIEHVHKRKRLMHGSV